MKEKGSRTLHLHLHTTLRLTPEAEKGCMGKKLGVYLPLPVEYAQVKNLKICGFPGNVGAPVRIDEGSYPQRTAYFETVIKGGERWETEYEFDNITVYRQPIQEKFCLSSRPSIRRRRRLISVLRRISGS